MRKCKPHLTFRLPTLHSLCLFPSAMVTATSSLSSQPFFLDSNTRHFLRSSFSKPNPNTSIHIYKYLNLLPHRTIKIYATNSNSRQSPVPIDLQDNDQKLEKEEEEEEEEEQDDSPLSLPSLSEKRSFAVATGELFIGIASRLINRRKKMKSVVSEGNLVPNLTDSDVKLDYGERIATVVEDSLEPEVLWEQRVKDVEAEKRRKTVTSPGFSFSAAGLLFPYHLGVAQFLIEKGYIKETTPLAGSSAGSIICAVIASGSSMQDALQATKVLAEDCRQNGTAFRLGAVLRDVLEKLLPDDAHGRCNGRVRVAVTQIIWRPRGLLIDQFDSKQDLINALFTSSFIPGYLAPRPATMFRNRLCIDGGLTLFMPPTSAPQTVRVCAFPASSLRFQGIGISPDCNPKNRLSVRQLFNWALEPADDYMLDKLFEFGYLDAAVWAEENPVNLIVQEQEDIPISVGM